MKQTPPMYTRSLLIFTLFASCALPLGLLPQAHADGQWAVPRADNLRSGRATTSTNLTNPQILRSHYLGGFVRTPEALAADVRGDATRELLTLVGGKLLVTDEYGSVLADSPPLGLTQLRGTFDFDNDGDLEILASSSRLLAVIDPISGELLWHQRSNGSWEYIAVQNVDGDPQPELIAHEYNGAACSGRDMWRFDFSTDQAFNAPQTTELLRNNGCAGQPFILSNFDASEDGSYEALQYSRGSIFARSIIDGTLLTSVNIHPSSSGSHFGTLWSRDLDGDGDYELLHASRVGYDQILFAVDFDGSNLTELWQRFVEQSNSNTSNINTQFVARSPSDLDGDGQFEFVVSLYNERQDNTWNLEVLNALTGEVRASLPDHILEDVLDLDGDGQHEIIALHAPGAGYAGRDYGTLRALRFNPQDSSLTQLWEIPNVGPHRISLPGTSTTGPRRLPAIAHQDLNGDDLMDLYVNIDTNNDGLADVLEAWSPTTPEPQRIARYETDKVLTEVLVLATGDQLSDTTSRRETWISLSEGLLAVLNPSLEPSQLYRGGGHSTSNLVVADLLSPSGDSSILIPNSRGQLEILDPTTDGSFDIRDSFSSTIPISPSILPLGPDQGPAFIVPTFAGDQITLTLYDHLSEPIWNIQTGIGRPNDQPTFRAADLNATGRLDLVTVLFNPETEKQEVTAFDGDNGALLWRFWQYNDDYPAPRDTIITDINGDDIDDVLYNSGRNTLTVLNGADGSIIRSRSQTYERSMLVGDIDSDPTTLEVLRGPGPSGWSVHDLSSGTLLWRYNTPIDYESDNLDLALIDIDIETSGLDVVAGNRFGRASAILGASTGEATPLWETWLYQGEALTEDPILGGSLTSPLVADLDGDGLEEALFGSSDGHLYAITRAGTLLWSLNLGFSLQQPILADLDQDGQGEIIVSAADGYVHVIGEPTLGTPDIVRDVAIDDNGQLDSPGLDIDTHQRLTRVGISISQVPEAVGFQARVLTETGTPLTDWLFLPQISGVLPARMLPNTTYVLEARPIDADGQLGSIAQSDGFITRDIAPPEILSLQATPELLPNPARENIQVGIIGEARDASALERLTLTIHPENAPNATLRQWSSLLENTAQGDIRVTWDGLDTSNTPATPGTYTLTLIATDRLGQEARDTTTLTILDASSPPPPTISSPQDRAILTTQTPTITGRATNASTVQVFSQFGTICSTNPTEDGSFSCAPPSPLPLGTVNIWAVSQNEASLSSPPSSTVTVRISPPDDTGPDAGGEDVEVDTTQDITPDITPDVVPDTAPDAAPESDASPDTPDPEDTTQTTTPPANQPVAETDCACSTTHTPSTPTAPLFGIFVALFAIARIRRIKA